MLTGFDNPVYAPEPLRYVSSFARQMADNMTTVERINSFRRFLRRDRQNICDMLVISFTQILKSYPDGDPDNFRKEMGPEEYLRQVDAESKEEGDDDE
jgi:hypothetical protein